jgi:hypothetical protein
LRGADGVLSCFAFGDSLHITTEKDNVIFQSVTADSLKTYLEKTGLEGVEVTKTEPSVEDCFMELLSK